MSYAPFALLRNRKYLILCLSLLSISFFIIAVFCTFSWFADQQTLKEHGQPDFNTIPETDLKNGLIVKGNIDTALDAYAQRSKSSGISSSANASALYYIIPIYGEAADGSIVPSYFITYKAEPEDFAALDSIVNQTWNGADEPTVLTIENARILTLPSNIKKYYDDWANDPQFYENGSFIDWCAEYNVFGTSDKTVIQSKMLPFMIDKTETAGQDPRFIWAFGGLAVVCLIILIIVVRRKKTNNNVPNNTGGPDIMRPVQ